MSEQFGVMTITHIYRGHASIAPCATGEITLNDGMVQGIPIFGVPRGLFACCGIHPRQPQATDRLRSSWIGHIHDNKDIVRKTGRKRRKVGPLTPGVPNPVDAKPFQWHEPDFDWVSAVFDVKDPHSC